MRRRQPLPRLWLMTDERQGEALWNALERLPRGSGIVFRHYDHPDRKALFDKVAKIARKRHLMLLTAGRLGRVWEADGVHGQQSASVHNLKEIRKAERAGAEFLFLSPVFPTRSHPGAKGLRRVRFALLARQAKLPVIALGGMNRSRARGLPHIHGWAAIDAWS